MVVRAMIKLNGISLHAVTAPSVIRYFGCACNTRPAVVLHSGPRQLDSAQVETYTFLALAMPHDR